MKYSQKTFGGQHDWAAKKMRVIVTNPEGQVTIKPFDDLPNKLEIVMSCFIEPLPSNPASVLRALRVVINEHGPCPDDENFWSWYIGVRQGRVATLHRDFIVMFSRLQQNGYYSKSFKPMLLNYRLKQRDGVSKGDTVLTEDEIAYVIRKTYDTSTTENRIKQKALDTFVLSLFTGARVADVRTIVKSEDERGNPVLLYHNHKATRSQSVAWSPAVEGALQRGLYKTQTKRSLLYASLKVALYEALPASSNRVVNYYYLRPGQGRELKADSRISHISFHSARHTFCTRLLRKGVSASIVAQLAGHKSIMTTMRYYSWVREIEANDILRDIYGTNTIASKKPNWGEGANDQTMPAQIHAAMLPKPQEGAIMLDDGGLIADMRKKKRQRKPSARQIAWQEKIKRLGIA